MTRVYQYILKYLIVFANRVKWEWLYKKASNTFMEVIMEEIAVLRKKFEAQEKRAIAIKYQASVVAEEQKVLHND